MPHTALIQRIKELYGIKEIRHFTKIQIGFDNHTYRFTDENDNAFYISGSNYADAVSIRTEQIKWAHDLYMRGIPTIDVLTTQDNTLLFEYDQYHWYMMREAQGVSIPKYNMKQSQSLGHILGQLHQYGYNYTTDLSFNPQYYLRDLDMWQELYHKNRVLFSNEDAQIIGERISFCASAKIQEVPAFITHNDLFKTNILWQGNTISGLIDFNSARIAYYTEDFAKAFDTIEAEHIESFMNAYLQNFQIERKYVESISFFLTLDLIKIIACWSRDIEQIEKSGKHPKNLVPYFDTISDKVDMLAKFIS